MNELFVRRLVPVLLLPALLALGACDRSSTDLDDDHEEFYRVEVIDRGQTARPVVATWISGQGWTGSIPPISLSSATQRISIGFRVYDRDGGELTLSRGGEYSMRYALASGAPQGILNLNFPNDVIFHGDHVHIYGAAIGTTQVQFVLWHIDHADDATDPITVSVVN